MRMPSRPDLPPNPSNGSLSPLSFGRLARSICTWIAALILALLPMAVAADFGGVLWWTQFVAGVAILLAVILAVPGLFAEENSRLLRQYVLLAPLVLWIAYAAFQTVPMMPSFVRSLSGASHTAYTEWIEPLVSEDGVPSHFPISLCIEQSRHALAVLMLVTGLAWACSVVFLTRARISMLLSVIALGAALHSAFGLLAMIYPDTQVFGADAGNSRFGSFVNRNNAALLLNFGLAASLGLLSWRLTALTGQEVDDPNFEYNDLLALISDRDSVIGVCSAVACIAGLLVCGSRGGLIACIAGVLLAFGWVRQRRGFRTIPVIVATVFVCVAVLLVPLRLDLQSIKRMEVFSGDDMSTVLRDGRLDHWTDGWETAVSHLPAGSGLGTYSYAYLPHQRLTSDRWYLHADNLWLELFVEQGIVGVLLAICLFVIWIRTLNRLDESPDPIDQGLRVTGWYLLAAIVVSQALDFGLILPANLFLLAVLVSVTVARGQAAGPPTDSIIFRSRRGTLACFGVGAVAIALTAGATLRLKNDAEIERLVRYTDASLRSIATDQAALSDLSAQIEARLQQTRSPALLNAHSEVLFRRYRLEQLLAANPQTQEEALVAYRQTSPSRLRVKRREDRKAEQVSGNSSAQAPGSPNAEDALCRHVLEASEECLRLLPLGVKARVWQLYVDFVHGDDRRTEIALKQLRQIYHRNPNMLIRLGSFAADSGGIETAKEMWRSSLELSSLGTVAVIQAADKHPNIRLQELLPDQPRVYHDVAAYLVQTGDPRIPLLEQALQRLSCEQCESKAEKARCEQLAGDTAFLLGKYDEAFSNYAQAIELTPTDVRLQIKYVRRLRDQGRRSDARMAARRARAMLPKQSATFTKMIAELGAADLEEVESRQ